MLPWFLTLVPTITGHTSIDVVMVFAGALFFLWFILCFIRCYTTILKRGYYLVALTGCAVSLIGGFAIATIAVASPFGMNLP